MSSLVPQITPKKFEDRDIDIEIDACGICGSDVHTIVSFQHDPCGIFEVNNVVSRMADGGTLLCRCASDMK